MFLSPGDLPNPRSEPRSPTLKADSLLSEPQGKQDFERWGEGGKEQNTNSVSLVVIGLFRFLLLETILIL